MSEVFIKLDNPAWYALTETHAGFSIGNNEVKRYRSDIVSFAAQQSGTQFILQSLLQLLDPEEFVFVIGEVPENISGLVIDNSLPCLQMICTTEIRMPVTATIEKLEKENDDEIVDLIELVQPGYYKPGTRLMGDYFGIRENGKLVAITGERMRMKGFSEVSAVVTHPEFTGRKYAQQLVAHVVNKNLSAGIIPFLHVAETNQRAIGIYELVGFVRRRIIHFIKVRRG